MKNRYIITITTIHGTRHFSVRQIVKYILLAFFLLIVIALVGGYAYITLLESKIASLQREKEGLQSIVRKLHTQITTAQNKIAALHSRIEDLNLALLERKQKLARLQETIDDLETKMGLRGEALFTNVDIKKLSSEDINTILTLLPSGSPTKKLAVSARFGWRKHPILKKREFHPGIDISGSGKVAVYATANGIVTGAGYNKYGYGNIVKLAHIYGFSTTYAHLKKIVVKKGDFVHKGQILGYMGSSGLSTGQHLHYEVRFNTNPLNPIKFIRWQGSNFYTIFKKERHIPWESLLSAIKSMQTKLPSLQKIQK